MLRTRSFFVSAAGLAVALLGSSCGEDSPTAPPADPNAGKHQITLDVHHFKVIGGCEVVSTNPGEFHYEFRVFSLQQDTLWVSYGNLTGLPGATGQPATHEFTFLMDPMPNQGFEFEPRCTEYDNGVPDSRMNEYGTTRTHMYGGGTNWGNGLHIIRLGNADCGYEVEYSVTVKTL
jgi:hypothetical protein